MSEIAANITALEPPVTDPSQDTPTYRTPRKPTKVQASEIQAFLHSHIMGLKTRIDSGERLGEDARDECNALASVVRAWDVAADRARIARGKPLPGSERPASRKPRRESRAAQSSPVEAQPQPVAHTAPDPVPPQT